MSHFKKKSKKDLENAYNDNCQLCSGEDDRLSSLPDNLLISILSLMPISSAVSTSVLSHRWRRLWTYLTHISFHFCWSYQDSFQKIENSLNTINHVISKLTFPKLNAFHLNLPFYDADDNDEQVCSSLLVPIVNEICLRNPEVIKIFLDANHYSCMLFKLPGSLFKTQSLVELKLASIFEFDFADDAQVVISLPMLKRLHLSLCDSHRCLMHTLFKSCPLLEWLYLELSLMENDHCIDILAPNLRFLTVEGDTRNCLLSIDAPRLENLKAHGYPDSVICHFLKSLRCLQEASVVIPKYYAGNGSYYLSRILALLQGISWARSITFSGLFHDQLSNISLPSFPNLVDLCFDCFDLGSSSWIPSCLLSHVKSVRLKKFTIWPSDYAIRLLRDILSNAVVLELLHVSHCGYARIILPETRLWKEYKFAMKLFNLPRSSSSCQIELFGEAINVSCEDFRDGQLTCKLRNIIYELSSDSDDMNADSDDMNSVSDDIIIDI